MQIECVNFRAINVGNFLGFADFYLSEYGIEIHGCTLYKKDDRRWINLPTRTYKSKDGQERYAQVVRFREQGAYRDFCTMAKEAVDAFVSKEIHSES